MFCSGSVRCRTVDHVLEKKYQKKNVYFVFVKKKIFHFSLVFFFLRKKKYIRVLFFVQFINWQLRIDIAVGIRNRIWMFWFEYCVNVLYFFCYVVFLAQLFCGGIEACMLSTIKGVQNIQANGQNALGSTTIISEIDKDYFGTDPTLNVAINGSYTYQINIYCNATDQNFLCHYSYLHQRLGDCIYRRF